MILFGEKICSISYGWWESSGRARAISKGTPGDQKESIKINKIHSKVDKNWMSLNWKIIARVSKPPLIFGESSEYQTNPFHKNHSQTSVQICETLARPHPISTDLNLNF